MATPQDFLVLFLLLFLKSPFPSSHAPKAEEAPTQSAGLSSGPGCMFWADRGGGGGGGGYLPMRLTWRGGPSWPVLVKGNGKEKARRPKVNGNCNYYYHHYSNITLNSFRVLFCFCFCCLFSLAHVFFTVNQ